MNECEVDGPEVQNLLSQPRPSVVVARWYVAWSRGSKWTTLDQYVQIYNKLYYCYIDNFLNM